ncbi:MAG: Rieske 2Fe-2S domain-containing protein [Pseudomonadota bacterium]
MCAFLMLTAILCIGPLARLDPHFLPLLYNRRHFGVLTALVALAHAGLILDWYYGFTAPRIAKLEGVLIANQSYAQLLGFPFELFGLFALTVLLILAATSHDFWLKFLTPPVWKRLHFLIYAAYAAVVAHIALGALQDQTHPALAALTLVAATLVAGLHGWAAIRERAPARAGQSTDLMPIGPANTIADGRARVIALASGERVAVFRDKDAFSAISNACAHQNGPLGEGRIIDGCVTCPWHGFQYRVTDGCSPAPFTEKVPTYRLELRGKELFLDPRPNPPGTALDPVRLGQM